MRIFRSRATRGMAVAMSAVVAASLSACAGAASSGSAKAPDKLVVAIPEDVDTFDVLNTLTATTHAYIGANIAETLAELDVSTGQLDPLLATAWKQTSTDAWAITVRSGVKFSDGTPMTASDAVSSIEYAIKNNTPYYQSFFPTIKSATVVDPTQFTISTSKPDPVLYKRLQFINVLPTSKLNKTFLATNLIGTGPYELKSRTPGQTIDLVANPNYWGKKPQFKSVQFEIRPDPSVRASSVQTGEADVALSLDVEQQHSVPKTLDAPGGQVYGYILNTVGQNQGSIMTDPRVRQAVNYAIDRKTIAAKVFGGHAILPNGQYDTPGMAGLNPTIKDYPYDPAKAKQLLQQAGAIGKPVRIRTNNTEWPKSDEMTDAVAGYLTAVGLKPVVTAVDYATWQKTQQGDLAGDNAPFDMFLTNHGNEFSDATMKTLTSLESHSLGHGIWLIDDKQLDAILQKTAAESNPATRNADMAQAWQIVYDNAYTLPIVVPDVIEGVNTHVQWKPRTDDFFYVNTITWS
jgi:peptide/nickel transport system substrate-binding protein